MKKLFSWLSLLCDAVFPARPSDVLVRKATHEDLTKIRYPKIIRLEGMEIESLLSYGKPLTQALILEAKFHSNENAFALLGETLAKALTGRTTHIKERSVRIILVPVPLGATRRKERGYNQVEETAKCAVKYAESITTSQKILLKPGILVRTRATTPQMTLGREDRLKNMTGAFSVPEEYLPIDPSCTYVLLDDVVTTGATLLAAYEALSQAGVKRIRVVALAH